MSASLVGSEMCIRDSPDAPEKRLRRATRRVKHGRLTRTSNRGLWPRSRSCLLYTSDAADDM
eukprot:7117727-Alexandrium_andersonii.AAC.1